MASAFVTAWLEERLPDSNVTYRGVDGGALHTWEADLLGTGHAFRLGIPETVVSDEGLLSERLMELVTQGWLDQAGEKDLWLVVGPGDGSVDTKAW